MFISHLASEAPYIPITEARGFTALNYNETFYSEIE
ncbi:hypothetical protein ERICV_05163 (plasmid) [Paenibacillus larvae subsp. larvae]|uniref:Uncharacterized protein n=1 Tax=Paenibacillus larvae subsp. larvae TaxID=147375 RepID=A0A6C0R042_9BACL|nr:hypothetical protein ERICV_05163 [Paenibacillus larvae subsp. larvae]